MFIFALSVSDQVERFGAIAGLAAFLAVAVLSVMLFAQARELKRLRDWAGRAPERALELEARVLADVAQRRVTPAPRPAPAAVAGAAAPAVAAAGTPAAQDGEPAAAAPAGDEAAAAQADTPGQDVAAEAEAAGAPPAEVTAAVGEPAAETDTETEAEAETAAEAAGERSAEPVGVAAGTVAGRAAAGGDGPGLLDPLTGGDEPPLAPVPVTGPSVTGSAARPRGTAPPVRPRPAVPLRQTAGGSRRPGQPPYTYAAGGRGYADDGRGSRGRTMALIAVAAVALVLAGGFAIFALGGEDAAPRPNMPGDPSVAIEGSPTTPSDTATTPAREGERAPAARADTTVAVLNGTVSTGLAATVADKIVAGGWTKGTVDNYTIDQARSATTVYYAADAREQARQVARALSVSAVEPVDEPTQALAPESQVIVVVGADQTP